MRESKAYYNEIDPFAVETLRELIRRGVIADGDVDTRSIVDVVPDDVSGFGQCHFFAGCGVWSRALRAAGWSDDRPVWTGSCPCPPFSTAGKKKACPQCEGRNLIPHPFRTGVFACCDCAAEWFADERHLWPEFRRLIAECAPGVVFGEQVGGQDGETWIDTVSTTLELEGYAVGSSVTTACGFGATDIRRRLYWVAHSDSERRQQQPIERPTGSQLEVFRETEQREFIGAHNSTSGIVADADGEQSAGGVDGGSGAGIGGGEQDIESGGRSAAVGLADTDGLRQSRQCWGREEGTTEHCVADGPGAVNGFWRGADWILCRDEPDHKFRAVEPCTFPLADGAAASVGRMQPRLEGMGFSAKEIKRILRRPRSIIAMAGRNRTGRLRMYGNAINAEQAIGFIEAVMETQEYG